MTTRRILVVWHQRHWLRSLGFIGLTLRIYELCMCIVDTSIIPTTYIYMHIHDIHCSSYIVILYWYPDHPGCWYWYSKNLPTCFFKNSQSWIVWEVETRCRTTARSAMPSTTPFITASNELGLRHELGSMGDLQDPTDWRYVNVPYFRLYFFGIFPEI